MTVKFRETLTNEEIENLKTRGAGLISSKKAVDVAYTFAGDMVDVDLLTMLYKHKKRVISTNPTPTGAVNLKGYQQLFRGLGIITWFLKTHVYPAFSGELPSDSVEGGAFDSIEDFVVGKRKGTFGDRSGVKKSKTGEAESDGEDEMEIEDGVKDAMGLDGLWFGSSDDTVPKAKPSIAPDHVWGSYAEVPTLPGLLFPYFPDMMENDYNYVSAVVKEHFLECLGDTRDEILSVYKDFKGSMGAVAATETGRVLQHMFLGISLAIRAQARMFPIIKEKRYLGFTLHGWYFSVSIDGYKHRPVEYKELAQKVRLVDEHAVAIAEIFSRLAKMKLTDTGKAPAKKTLIEERSKVVHNPRLLNEFIRRFNLDLDDKEEIEKLTSRLSFPQRYWPFTVDNVLRAVDLLIADSFPPVDLPMYPRSGTITTSDPALSVFALFGECGFSFKTSGGKAYKVPASISGDTVLKPYKGKNQKEVKPNPTFVLSKKSLGLCVEDWKVFMADRQFLNKETRDAAFRAIRFGGPFGVKFWTGIVERVGSVAIAEGSASKADQVELGDDILEEAEDDFGDFL